MNVHKLFTYNTSKKAPPDLYTPVNQPNQIICIYMIENDLYLHINGTKKKERIFIDIHVSMLPRTIIKRCLYLP